MHFEDFKGKVPNSPFTNLRSCLWQMKYIFASYSYFSGGGASSTSLAQPIASASTPWGWFKNFTQVPMASQMPSAPTPWGKNFTQVPMAQPETANRWWHPKKFLKKCKCKPSAECVLYFLFCRVEQWEQKLALAIFIILYSGAVWAICSGESICNLILYPTTFGWLTDNVTRHTDLEHKKSFYTNNFI